MLDIFIPALVTLFVVIDPPGIVPLFASLTEGTPRAHKRVMAIRSVLVGAFVLTLFAFGGEWLLGALGIGLDAFRAAGGVMLFLIALDMVFEKRTERREQRAEQVSGEDHTTPEDISVFPMGIPMIAGPGAIATIMLFMSRYEGNVEAQSVVLAAAGLVLLLCLIVFWFADVLTRLMGKTLSAMITRMLGVLLAALSAQLIFDGVKGAFT